MSEYIVYSQANPPEPQSEVISTKELAVLDKVSITKVTEFMHKFASDSTFSPPTLEVMYDSDKVEVSINDDIETIFDEDFLEDYEPRARDDS